MAGSAALFKRGYAAFGNADQNTAANKDGLGGEILQTAEQRQQRLLKKDGNVVVNEIPFPTNDIGKRKPPYDMNVITGPKGLEACLEQMSKVKFKGPGHEVSNLKKLIKNYRDWAYFMYPSMNFKDLVKRTQTFSSNHKIKAHLQKLRDKRDGFDSANEADNMDEDEDIDLEPANNNDDNAAAPPPPPPPHPQQRLQRHTDDNEADDNEELTMVNMQQQPSQNDNHNHNPQNPNHNQNAFEEAMAFDMGNPMDFEADDNELELANLMYG
eukprot:CAMPEP_0202698428 /NCGR_PEP_ID=MMETSP1385-20130828/11716_1 /ASSEMBLY_ACC=CAM_ASM_000861 /TAXON_ID=933848 /ORGANISM="Elphidium margaritaceum" /LENGTH=268 /DNA_ID=CAMNT_0049355147 /DNA_START=40 /DNA_END=846 /DNA_ORIENTATION=-